MGGLVFITVILILTQVCEIDSTCGGYFTTNVGSFSSPNYPSKYSSLEFCSWTIKVTDNYVISLIFSSFELEGADYDIVKIFDVQPGGQRFLRGTWTGENTPPIMQSVFSSFVIEFTSDTDVQLTGFSASWSRTLNLSDIVLKTGPRGDIKSPNYPFSYPDNLAKSWKIMVPLGDVVLNFTSFGLGNSCSGDTIEIFDVLPDDSLSSMGKWCASNVPPSVKSNSSRLLVKLNTDNVAGNNGPGFVASWNSNLICGAYFTKNSGLISFPNGPIKFTHDYQLCEWNIKVTRGNAISLYFLKPFHVKGEYNFVKVFEVLPTGQRSLTGTWAGWNRPPPFLSSTSTIGVELRIDPLNLETTFSAYWSKVDIKDCIANHTGCACGVGLQFNGSQCIDIDECLSNNGGCGQVCTNIIGSRYCSCYSGYRQKGLNCTDVNECVSDNGGCDQHCNNTVGSWDCSCDWGYIKNGTKCIDFKDCIANHTGCACGVGLQFNGSQCIDIDECVSNNGGCDQVCTNIIGSRYCGCYSGYRQKGLNCTDVNECVSNNGGCDQHCNNTVGSWDCSCDWGYRKNGTKCIDIDECHEYSDSCDQICTNAIGSYTCSCHSGFTQTGNNCTDIDECHEHSDSCDQICTNAIGSYTCSCHSGFTQTGNNCTDIDECHEYSDSCDQICTNAIGSYTCSCDSGFTQTGNNCTDIDECHEYSDSCDQICTNAIGSYTCSCHSGFTQTGNNCTDIDECHEHSDSCDQICTNAIGSYTCSCHSGFTQTGNNCTDYDACMNNNGGCDQICTNTYWSYSCSCYSGYTSHGNECIDNGHRPPTPTATIITTVTSLISTTVTSLHPSIKGHQ